MDKIYKCDKCMFAGATRASLKNHYRNHSGEKPYKCDICSYATAKSHTMKVHKRIHSDEKSFKCDICPFASTQSQGLKLHMRNHAKGLPYKCSLCSYNCASTSSLTLHMRMHYDDIKYRCNRCNYATNYKRTIENHIRTHDPEWLYECNQCSFKSTSLNAMEKHVRYHAGGLRDSNSVINNVITVCYSEGLYKCGRCSYASASFKSTQIHMHIHSDELWCDNGKYPKSNLNALPNAREDVVSGTINCIIATPPSSYSLYSQSNLSESSNDSVHMLYDGDKKYKFTYANGRFKAAQKQMRTRSGRHHYSLSSNTAQPKTNHNNASENVTTIGESAINPSNLPLYDQIPFYAFSSTSDLQAKATNQFMNDICCFDELPVSDVANDIINSNFCDVEHTEDENLDFYAEEQASEEAYDNHKNINEDIHELLKNSIVYENLCYADYTEDDFNFDVDE